jgi:hypothetical protein
MNNNPECVLDGLAWYSNTTTVKPHSISNELIINDLYIEGIDYLQVFGTGTKKRRSKRFRMTDLKRSTRLYKKTYLITDEVKNCKVCVLNCEPSSPVLPEGAMSIKFDNEILYLKFFNAKYLKGFYNSIGFKFKHISRLDIYRDFQKFKNFMPESLITNFMNQSYLSNSRAKFNTIGVNNAEGLTFQYLRNGMKSSGRQFYLYNKSLELKEVGIKEHIIKTWEIAGFNNEVDVWRLELSLTRGKRNTILDEVTGELEGIELNKVFCKGFLHSVYEGGLKSSFSFVYNEHKRKTRSKKIKLFAIKKKYIRLIFGSSQCDKVRMRKIIVVSLIKDMMREAETREHRSRSIEEQIESINSYVIDQNMDNHVLKILKRLSREYKCDYFSDVGKFIYNYYAQLAGF